MWTGWERWGKGVINYDNKGKVGKLTARSVEMRLFLRLTPSEDSEDADGELQEDFGVSLERILSAVLDQSLSSLSTLPDRVSTDI